MLHTVSLRKSFPSCCAQERSGTSNDEPAIIEIPKNSFTIQHITSVIYLAAVLNVCVSARPPPGSAP